MPDPLVRSPSPAAPRPLSPPSQRRGTAPLERPPPVLPSGLGPGAVDGRSFRSVLVEAAARIDTHERAVDAALARARRGAGLSPPELIAVQAGVYRYAHELELATKLVDKASGAVRQTLESQR